MDHRKNIQAKNDDNWYTEFIILEINRMSVLNIVASLELVLRHPDLPPAFRKRTLAVCRSLALRLIGDGIIIPDNVIKSWRETLDIIPEKGLSTVQEDR